MNTATETLTIVKSTNPEHLLAKQFVQPNETFPDGKIAWDNPWEFKFSQTPVTNIAELSATLAELEQAPDTAVIRGVPLTTNEDGTFIGRRQLRHNTKKNLPPTLREEPRHWVCVDVDKVHVPEHLEPEQVPEHVVLNYLPETFATVSYHYQFSSSAGKDNAWGNIHLWFWLEHAHTQQHLTQVFKGYQVDPAMFRTVQIHYTAAPVFRDVPSFLGDTQRSRLVEKELAAYTLPVPVIQSPVFVGKRREIKDLWLNMADKQLIVKSLVANKDSAEVNLGQTGYHHNELLKLRSIMESLEVPEDLMVEVVDRVRSPSSSSSWELIQSSNDFGNHAGIPTLEAFMGRTLNSIFRETGNL